MYVSRMDITTLKSAVKKAITTSTSARCVDGKYVYFDKNGNEIVTIFDDAKYMRVTSYNDKNKITHLVDNHREVWYEYYDGGINKKTRRLIRSWGERYEKFNKDGETEVLLEYEDKKLVYEEFIYNGERISREYDFETGELVV